MMKTFKLITFSCLVAASLTCSKNNSPASPDDGNGTDDKGWKLVWSDEFDYDGLPNSQKWGYDVGGNGWGNNELQYYTENRLENSWVKEGRLFVQARREPYSGREYTSSRIVSRGKGDWTYGRFEVRARLPHGRGTWPAIWMLPTDWTYGNGGWPDNGEIDIMEHVGYDSGVIHASTHSHSYNWPNATQKTAILNVPDAETALHIYTLEWNADTISVFVDSTKYFTQINEHTGWQSWPFDKKFHLILNLAIGGNWGGAQGVDNSVFPQRLEIDYVRVYEWIE